jgi:hypothetical protein
MAKREPIGNTFTGNSQAMVERLKTFAEEKYEGNFNKFFEVTGLKGSIFTGTHNFTFREVAHLEEKLGIKLIQVL